MTAWGFQGESDELSVFFLGILSGIIGSGGGRPCARPGQMVLGLRGYPPWSRNVRAGPPMTRQNVKFKTDCPPRLAGLAAPTATGNMATSGQHTAAPETGR